MNRLQGEIVRRNRDARDSWQRYTAHRQRVTQLLIAALAEDDPEHHLPSVASSTGARLCLLGAGNANDLDLAALAEVFSEVHLVDVDGDALQAGVERQQRDAGLLAAARQRVVQHSGVDISGVLAELGEWEPSRAPGPAAVEAVLARVAAASAPLAGQQFAVVGSICLLSQLVFTALQALGGEHPRFAELVAALRLRHLQMLLNMTRPGGAAVLIHDFVSSDSLPAMATIAPAQFSAAMQAVMQTSNVFFGLSPLRIEYLLQHDPGLKGRASSRCWTPAWRWDFGPRSYAVTALTLRLPGELG